MQPPVTPAEQRERAVLLLGLAAVAAAYAAVKWSSLFIDIGDEGIYVYGGRLVAEGHLPYRDFFLAHPPLRVLIAAATFAVGAPVAAVKLICLLATIVAGICVALATAPLAGAVPAVIAAALYLFATIPLKIGTAFVGANIATAAIAAAMALCVHRRFFLAGLALSLGSWHALFAALPTPLLLWWAARGGGTKKMLLGLAVGPALHGVTALAFDRAYVEQVFGYQLAKASAEEAGYPLAPLFAFLRGEAGAIAFALAALLQRRRRSTWLLICGLGCVALVASYRSPVSYYYLLPLPFLAAASGCGLFAVWRRFADRPRGVRAAVGAVIAAALVVTYLPHAMYTHRLQGWYAARAHELDALVAMVERHRPPSGLIWGDAALTPLVAVRTGLEIAGHEIDTNAKRFRSGTADAGEMLPRLFGTAEPPAALLIREHGAWRVEEVRSYVESELRLVFGFRAAALNADCMYFLGRRAQRGPAPSPPGKTP